MRLMPNGMSFYEVFKRLGWSKTTQYQRRRYPDLRISEAAQIAVAAEIHVGLFLEACALEAGIAPLAGDGPPISPRTGRSSDGQRRCSTCGRVGHTRATCKTFEGMPEAQRMKARAAAKPRKKRRPVNPLKET